MTYKKPLSCRQSSPRPQEKGNVLFLILIAVCLFAALSYAVTQSVRSSGGSTNSETTLINSAEIAQYPATVRSAVVRMMINGVDFQNLQFNPPEEFTSLTSPKVGVFHPDGGGATSMKVPAKFMADGTTPGVWTFNPEFEIEHVGTSVPGSLDGNDLIAFLPYISKGVCEKLNEELGVAPPQQSLNSEFLKLVLPEYTLDHDYGIPGAEYIIGPSGAPEFDYLEGQPYGCYQAVDDVYVYYHVLLER